MSNKNILEIKKSALYEALLISSLIITIPALVAIEFPNIIFIGILVVSFLVIVFIIFNRVRNESPCLIVGKHQITINNKSFPRVDIDYFRFIHDPRGKPKIDPNWWIGDFLILEIKFKDGQQQSTLIPNQLLNVSDVKKSIRSAFKKIGVKEGKSIHRK